MFGGQRFGGRQHALGGIEEDRVGISAAGIEAEKKGQGGAGLVRNGATFTMPAGKENTGLSGHLSEGAEGRAGQSG